MATPSPEIEVEIARLGARGDGIVETPAGPLYVPLALPGERVRVRPGAPRGDGRAAALVEIVAPSPDRVAPPCPYFGRCGGCAVQHLAEPAYLDWKRAVVTTALERRKLDGRAVAPVVATPARGRRRAELAAVRPRRAGADIVLGFHAPGSSRVVGIDACAVLTPALTALLAPLRAVLGSVQPPGGRCDVLLTETDAGVDMLVSAAAPPRPAQSHALAAFADAADLARIAWRSPRGGIEPVAQRRRPTVTLAGVAVALPPGVFVQASRAAERVLGDLVAAAAARAPARARIADLYAGIGTFALPLARGGARVHAVDGAPPPLQALAAAVGAAGLGGRLTTEVRDLAARPLMAGELAAYDVVLFDPPRAGAAAQARQLAACPAPRVIAVSCNPATFARDAATLVAGGYRVARVTPVDQFVYTGHVELVGVFARD